MLAHVIAGPTFIKKFPQALFNQNNTQLIKPFCESCLVSKAIGAYICSFFWIGTHLLNTSYFEPVFWDLSETLSSGMLLLSPALSSNWKDAPYHVVPCSLFDSATGKPKSFAISYRLIVSFSPITQHSCSPVSWLTLPSSKSFCLVQCFATQICECW